MIGGSNIEVSSGDLGDPCVDITGLIAFRMLIVYALCVTGWFYACDCFVF